MQNETQTPHQNPESAEFETFNVPTELAPSSEKPLSDILNPEDDYTETSTQPAEADPADKPATPEGIAMAIRRAEEANNMLAYAETTDDSKVAEKAGQYLQETRRLVGHEAVNTALFQQAALEKAARDEQNARATILNSGIDSDSTGPRESAQRMPAPRRN